MMGSDGTPSGADAALAGAESLPVDGARYRLGDRLGGGGAGVVHAAWDTLLEREVAIKQVPLNSSGGGQWQREAQVAARLQHPALVAVLATFCDATHAHLVMERVPGHTVKALVAQQAIAPATACDWVRQAAEGLAAAHAQGVVHGDIKPSNLMVEPSGAVRVLDFGIAHLLDPLATLNVASSQSTGGDGLGGAGTLAYMAPEQLHGQAPSAASDVYALGLVLAELLQGQSAYGGLSGLSLAYEKLHGALPVGWVPGPPDLGRLLSEMTARDPAARLADMGAVARRLAALDFDRAGWPEADTQRLPAQPTPDSVADARERSRWRATRATIVAVVLSVLLGGVALWAIRFGWIDRPDAGATTAPVLTAQQTLERLAQAESLLADYDDPPSLAQAVTMLEGVVAQQPRHASALALLAIGRCLQYKQNNAEPSYLEDAHALSDQALALDDQMARAHTARGWYLTMTGDQAGAAAVLQKALLLSPQDWLAEWIVVANLISSNQLDKAKAVLDRALAAHPQERVFLDYLGTWHVRQSQDAEAEAAFRRSIALKPSGSVGYLSLNMVLMRKDRLDEALTVLQQGLQVRPNHRLYSNLGAALFLKGRYADAAEADERALTTLPQGHNDGLYQSNLAEALEHVPGQDARAATHWRKALASLATMAEQSPTRSRSASYAGLAAAKLGETDTARRWTDIALERSPSDGEVWFNAAVVAARASDVAQAAQRVARAQALGYPASWIEKEPLLARFVQSGTAGPSGPSGGSTGGSPSH